MTVLPEYVPNKNRASWNDEQTTLLYNQVRPLCHLNKITLVQWEAIAKKIPGMTALQCKNRWTYLKTKITINNQQPPQTILATILVEPPTPRKTLDDYLIEAFLETNKTSK